MVRRLLRAGAVVLLFFTAAFLLFLPFPRRSEATKERYHCIWSDGVRTQERYATAYSALKGISDGEILLEREGTFGKIEGSAEFAHAASLLESGSLAELLALETEGLGRLERAALCRVYGDRGYYSEEFFCYDGTGVSRTARKAFNEVILLSGDLPKDLLFEAGAEKLGIRAEAEFSAKGLCGAKVTKIVAQPPYLVREDAVYLDTVGGRRLVAALPGAKRLEIECDFIDEGALSPCRALEELTLPKGYEGTLRMLFGEAGVPSTLKLLNGETYEKVF